MNILRQLREQSGCSQIEFADRLHVSHETYRTWDSGRRRPPRRVITAARRLCDTQCGQLLPLHELAEASGIHVRTLRQAAKDGRLSVTFSTRTVFGRLVAFATRDAVAQFQQTFYRRTTRWTARPSAPVAVVPDDYDRTLVQLRAAHGWSQAALAARLGAANKAVIYQWEARKRRPSPLFWHRLLQLQTTLAASA
jgi:transcriptional regulator with XRE-family HTH domain